MDLRCQGGGMRQPEQVPHNTSTQTSLLFHTSANTSQMMQEAALHLQSLSYSICIDNPSGLEVLSLVLSPRIDRGRCLQEAMPNRYEPTEGYQIFCEEDCLAAEHLGATAWTESRLDDLEGVLPSKPIACNWISRLPKSDKGVMLWKTHRLIEHEIGH